MVKLKQEFLRCGLSPLILWTVLSLTFLTLSRLMLMILYWDHLAEGSLIYTLAQGVRVDFATVCGLMAPAMLLLLTLNAVKRLPKILLILLRGYLALSLMLIVLNEAATPSFINEYGLRPNHLYVRYLIYPHEVISMLVHGHLLASLLTLAAVAAALAGGYILTGRLFRDYRFTSLKVTTLSLLLVLCIIPLGIRSTLGHRPLNPAMIAFCQDEIANTLPLNSTYSAVYALTHMDTKLSASEIYDFVDDNTAIAALNELSARQMPAISDDKCPLNQVIGSDSNKTYNVVVILEESLGSSFVASLGGLPLTPELEKLKTEGWWFSSLFAAGHRSIRGIEAITASYPPSPLESVVKLPAQTESLTTLSEIFSELGYHTSFIYGGESHFDNMRSYFLGTGTQEIIEQKDYEHPEFVASWGVSDEDLFKKADKRFAALSREGKPFFSVVFTSSFHDPFDIPDGKVSLPEGIDTQEPKRLLAAMYADYALGEFFRLAKTRDYYQDTVFLIVADHESRVRGYDANFPIREFKIPALIIGPQVIPHEDARLVSQIDLPVTLLSLAGVKGEIPMTGQNLAQETIKERAIMQFNSSFAYYEDDKLTVLDPSKRSTFFSVGEDLKLTPDTEPFKLKLAEAAVNLGPVIYKNNLQSRSCLRIVK